MATFKARFTESPVFHAGFFDGSGFEAEFGEFQTILPDPYTGPYEITPSQSTQTLATENKAMAQNVVIDPIPNCYGLITWDGSKLRVS